MSSPKTSLPAARFSDRLSISAEEAITWRMSQLAAPAKIAAPVIAESATPTVKEMEMMVSTKSLRLTNAGGRS
jgi:hypothetical protein